MACKKYKIVLTGGPCAGKTTSFMRIKKYLEDRGFVVLTIPESATISSTNGIKLIHQEPITKIQKSMEDIFFNYADYLVKNHQKDVVVLLDRAIIDGSVYVSTKEFEDICNTVGLSSLDGIYNRYDLVLYLVSASEGAEQFYDNTMVRGESLEEARQVEARTVEQWSKYSCLKVFDNKTTSFEKKIKNVVGEVCSFLGISHTEKTPIKYIIEGDAIDIPENIPTNEEVVEKIFVTARQNKENVSEDEPSYSFIRSSICGGVTSFFIKTVVFRNNQRIERKDQMNARQYETYKQFADPERSVVVQKRIMFSVGGTHYEICHYLSHPKGLKLLSVYTPSEDHKRKDVEIPEFLGKCKGTAKDHRHSAHYLSLKDKSGFYELSGQSFDSVVYEKIDRKNVLN